MRNARGAVLALICAVCLSSCARTAAGIVGESLGVPLEERVVSSKMEPNILIATDGSSCEVSKGRWEKAKVGEPVICIWSNRTGATHH